MQEKKHIPVLALIAALLPITMMVKAQQPADTIRISFINQTLIQGLIKAGIDSIRVMNGLPPLLPDSSLCMAAADHSVYLRSQRWISHRQTTPLKETVQKRVEHFGGKDFLCGENIAASYALENIAEKNGFIYRNHTYRQLADDFVRLWCNSGDHYQNVINPLYNFTGVAVSFNPKSKRVVAVQVFGYKKPTG